MKQIKIAAIIVTYSQRSEYVKKVLKSAFCEGVAEVVLVDNASQCESQLYYSKLVEHDHRIHLIRNEINLGSAGGFKGGISYLLKNITADFVWLLDDDNVPQNGSLNSLIHARELLLSGNTDQKDFVFYSYRGDTRIIDKKAVTTGYIKDYKDDNFMGFRIQDFLKEKILNNSVQYSINYPIVRVYHGPYGGAFFSFKVLNDIGLPDESFFVYADDHEFTNRINKLNIDQYLIYNSKLLDIDESFERQGFFADGTTEYKVYYTFRNHVYLNQNHIKSYFIYFINKHIFISNLLYNAIKFSFYNFKKSLKIFKIIIKGINDGENLKNVK